MESPENRKIYKGAFHAILKSLLKESDKMEKIIYCELKKKEVTKEDCKNCKQKEEQGKFFKFKVCKSASRRIKCPKCGEVFE